MDTFKAGDRVVIRRDVLIQRIPLTPAVLRELQVHRTVGTVVHVDEHGVVVSFAGDEWRLTADELELWKPPAPAIPLAGDDGWELVVKADYDALRQERDELRAELVTFAIIIHQCVGLSELMLVGYDTENGNALLKRAEKLMNGGAVER